MTPKTERSAGNNSRDSMDSGEDSDRRTPAEKPVSLHPLKFEEAVKGLLRVKPEKARAKESAKD